MEYPILDISIQLRENESNTYIPLNGKNLIVVGDNGAGKTKFLTRVNSWLERFYNHHEPYSVENFRMRARTAKKQLDLYEEGSQNYIQWSSVYNQEKSTIDELEKFNIVFSSSSLFKEEVKNKKLILKFFPAQRKYESSTSNLLTSIESLFTAYNNQILEYGYNVAGDYFERFLVSMSNYALLQKGSDNLIEYSRIDKVIRNIESDIQSLLENDTLKLRYNLSSLRMEILQEGRDNLLFEMLPSGFASILAIYAELIMHAELRKIEKGKLEGIVIIDEIDAHLHITLQKKVFDFFSKGFPGIQFIISTHSPFVVQSVSDSIIFNLSTKEVMGDLSLYSYTSIISGLLGETTNSEELETLLNELDILSRNDNFNERFHQISNILGRQIGKLDGKSKSILMMANNKYIDWVEGD
ncbi:AAA family ATPase [Pantoea ananatis]|uniref:AAA family ATPase n=1 Tax=Pantoea ananas TaxID=553 RepID=UPI001B30FB98|nr:AAA family ATPase [Pantoea ananatis]